jgi:hypothetical protein
MTLLRGWSPRGERLTGKAPYGHWNTMTFIAALRCDRVEAPWLINGPINGDRFQLYVEKVLLPTLQDKMMWSLPIISPATGVEQSVAPSARLGPG